MLEMTMPEKGELRPKCSSKDIILSPKGHLKLQVNQKPFRNLFDPLGTLFNLEQYLFPKLGLSVIQRYHVVYRNAT